MNISEVLAKDSQQALLVAEFVEFLVTDCNTNNVYCVLAIQANCKDVGIKRWWCMKWTGRILRYKLDRHRCLAIKEGSINQRL